MVRAANAFIDRAAPWHLRKTDRGAMERVLATLLETIRVIATVLQPVMPGSMAKLLDQLGVPAEKRSLAALAEALPAGERLPPPEPLFPRLASGLEGEG